MRPAELDYCCCLSAEILLGIDCRTDVFRSSKGILFPFLPICFLCFSISSFDPVAGNCSAAVMLPWLLPKIFFLAVFPPSPLSQKSTATSGELLHLFHLMQKNSSCNYRLCSAPKARAAWFVWLAILSAHSARAECLWKFFIWNTSSNHLKYQIQDFSKIPRFMIELCC